MPCTLRIGVPTGGGAYVVSLLPSMNTESLGAPESTMMNELLVPRPPVSDVRATFRFGPPLIFTRQPSYCSTNVLVLSSFSWVVVPTKNGGSALPDETLRTMPLGAPKLLFGASTSVAPWNSAVAIHSTTIESPTARLCGAAPGLTP